MRIFAYLTAVGVALFLGQVAWAAPADEPVFGPGSSQNEVALDTIVAVVNDDIITRSELRSAVAMIELQLQQRGTPLPPQEVLERQVLERLIVAHLEVREADENGVVVDDQTINAALEDIAQRNNITLAQLRDAIEYDGFSFAKFRDDIRTELLTARLRQKVVDSRIQVTEQEVDAFLAQNRAGLQGGEYHLAQILIGLPDNATADDIAAAREKVQVVMEQLAAGADFQKMAVSVSDGRQALEGGDLGWRKVDQLPTLFANVVPKLQVGQVSEPIRSPSGFHILKVLEVRGAQQNTVVQTNVKHILITTSDTVSDDEARTRLQRLRERIVNGADFSELARANSDDAPSAANGGDLGWVNPGDLVPQFEEQMNALGPGDISEPIRTPFGWHLVLVVDRREHDASSESLRAAAREALFKRKSDEEWDLWLKRLRDEAYVEIRI